MITITYICDKCGDVVAEDIPRMPSYNEWVKTVRKTLKSIYVDKDEFSICDKCFKDWTKVKDKKDKEKKDEFFGLPSATTTTA
jgi:hypothetical protein